MERAEKKKSKIIAMAAVARNRVIGVDGKLPWHLPVDAKLFMDATRGKPVIMGKRSFESVARFMPKHTGHQLIAVSRDPGYDAFGEPRAESLEEAIRMCEGAPEIFLGGGFWIYQEGMAFADELRLTEILADYEGDTLFPEVDPEIWREESRRRLEKANPDEPDCDFVVYRRKRDRR